MNLKGIEASGAEIDEAILRPRLLPSWAALAAEKVVWSVGQRAQMGHLPSAHDGDSFSCAGGVSDQKESHQRRREIHGYGPI